MEFDNKKKNMCDIEYTFTCDGCVDTCVGFEPIDSSESIIACKFCYFSGDGMICENKKLQVEVLRKFINDIRRPI